MSLRPRRARWFEVVVARDDAFLALEALAGAGCIEIEWHATEGLLASTPAAAAAQLRQYTDLARRYGRFWPPARIQLGADARAPVDALAQALATLSDWAQAAEPAIAELQSNAASRSDLELADRALAALADGHLDFELLAQSQRSGAVGVSAALFALPADAALALPDEVLTRQANVGAETLLIAVGAPAAIDSLARAVIEANGRQARFPDWLQPTAQASRAQLAQRHAALAVRERELHAHLAQLAGAHGVANALGDVARATWCFEHAGAINLGDPTHGDVLARLTGWCTDDARLIAAIEAGAARALVDFPPPPRGARPPLVLANPWWVQPFELFPRLIGMPGASGADPSLLLAFVVPLMFGYMFGDVGQGLVLALAGLLLARRLPVLRLLVPCGIAAAVFGFVFGSVFTMKHLVEPLWLRPLADPLTVLVVPIVAGSALLTLGLLLDLLQSWWQRQIVHWLRADLPALAVYLGLLLAFVTPIGWLIAAAGAVLAAVLAALAARADAGRAPPAPLGARAARPRGALVAAAAALGELIERTLQILINTVSFARVGAFALVHAGLSSAAVTLAAATGSLVGAIVVLVAGNLLILLLEGLVVSVQTTRLVLFEFFTRFFKPEGRAFRPLLAPPPALASAGAAGSTQEK